MKYHVSIEHKGDLGLGGGVWSGFNVEAETPAEAKVLGMARFEAERSSTKPGKVRVEPVLRYDITFRYRKDKRKRETFVVEGYTEGMAISGARYLAQQKGGLEYTPIKVVMK